MSTMEYETDQRGYDGESLNRSDDVTCTSDHCATLGCIVLTWPSLQTSLSTLVSAPARLAPIVMATAESVAHLLPIATTGTLYSPHSSYPSLHID